MAGPDIAISRLAVVGSPTYAALTSVDVDGNQRISAEEIARLSPQAPPPGLTGAGVTAVQSSFLNTLPPAAARGVRLGAAPAVVPASGQVQESWGTAAKTLVLAGSAFPTVYLEDDKGNAIGEMTRRWTAKGAGDLFQNLFGVTLTLKDKSGAVIGEARPRLIDTKNLGNNFRTLVDIYDPENNRIGTIRQTWESLGGSVLQNLALGGSIWTSYEILDPNDQVIAKSAKTEFFGTSLDVKGDTGHVGRFERHFFESALRDTWHFNTDANAQVDRRILVFMAAYKTMADIQKQQKGLANLYGTLLDAAAKSK